MQIGKYERGDDRIDAARLFEIARALDVPVVTLFDAIAWPRGFRWPAFAAGTR
jgi:transcriptional regulator with XRE-family HTH domain